MSTLRCNAIQDTSGVERYLARAWVNFNGSGTVAIRASGNVSSITDNGTGDYTVNLTNAMPDTNYSVSCSPWFFSDGFSSAGNDVLNAVPRGTNSVRLRNYESGVVRDLAHVSCQVFR